jgi:hypothetical protein
MCVIMVTFVCEIMMYYTEQVFQARHFYKACFGVDGNLIFVNSFSEVIFLMKR